MLRGYLSAAAATEIMSLFAIQAAADSWIMQNLQAAYNADPRVKGEWWFPLCQSLQASQFRELNDWFVKVDKDKSGTLELNELTKAKWPKGIKMTNETAIRLMRIFDIDGSGSIGFYEFLALYNFMNLVIDLFKKYDADKSDSMDLTEMSKALPELGFYCNMNSCKALIKMNGASLGKPRCNLTQFLSCCAYLGQIRSIYQHVFGIPREQIDQVEFNKFVNLVLGLIY